MAPAYGTARNFRRPSRTARWRLKAAVVRYGAMAIVGFFALNWIYQVARKPGEILAPLSGSLAKTPEASWQSYGRWFEKYSTDIISPELLAALAQLEGSGNPIAHTYWRWQWSWNPFHLYRPASSALGMFQITDGTFAEARKYCIHNHQLASEGSWLDPHSCWFNGWYTRTVPSHAIELTAAYLHRSVMTILNGRPRAKTNIRQKQRLAAVIHLCGLGRGKLFADRGFRPQRGERCGSHDVGTYLSRADLLMKRFARLSAMES